MTAVTLTPIRVARCCCNIRMAFPSPVAQVAQSLGKSEGTIKRDLFDARKLLRERLEGQR
ncbi:hypothetical protein GCM10027599_15770 [Yimella radicis]